MPSDYAACINAVCTDVPVIHINMRSLNHALVICRELFKDGYDAQGNRIYDKVSGMTCHQCRQKTLGLHTSCSECQTLHVGPRKLPPDMPT